MHLLNSKVNYDWSFEEVEHTYLPSKAGEGPISLSSKSGVNRIKTSATWSTPTVVSTNLTPAK
ncbi:hypothetical protein A1E80_RS07560 [Acinetobacter baumannii]|nr:hypothetical protein [Acinetobacter baumannii]EHU1749818.1 hypothetical protein [Acinetobacter baumannii]EHU1802411.1 hypothetical protein [Acinetobacter baumannii]EHU1951487.1 hypothetical protein [Acinetobacter baumannii]